MLINKLVLNNIGIYHGENEFNLRTNSNKENIILIGGKNGGGKTTFFNSLKLCLYGQNAFDKNISKEKYEAYLKSRIHKNPKLKTSNNFASITIEFEHSHQSIRNIYEITRSWEINYKQGINEIFEVKVDGKLLQNLKNDDWQDFVNDLIPKGLVELFFFDGEKIMNLVDDSNDSIELSNSFKALLGLEIVEKLDFDLDIFYGRQIKLENKTGLGDELEANEKNIEQINNELDKLIQEKGEIVNNKERIVEKIKNLELKIQSEGGNFAQKRDELKRTIFTIEHQISDLENKFRLELGSHLPFLISKKSILKLKSRLEKEEKLEKAKFSKEVLDEKFLEIKEKLSKELNKKQLSQISDILNVKLENKKILHNLSQNDKIKVFNLIETISNESNKFSEFTEEHNKLSKKLNLAQKELSYAPNDEVIAPLINELNKENKEFGLFENKLSISNNEIEEKKLEIEQLKKNILEIKKQIKENQKYSEKLVQIEKVKSILGEFNLKLKELKLKEFCNEFIDIYNQISRKKGKFDKVEIDPSSFNVTLIKESKGGEIRTPKRELSEGEKQMYALAVLWTLTKLSRRPLPFIIDTPLGRLDHNHRENLIKTFFPKISKQLIILSTDSEIDENYFNLLNKNVSRSYLLNENDGSTKVKEGYFF